MRGRSNRQKRNNKNEAPKNVIRCNHFQRIVWDHEICNEFSPKENSSSEKNCKNCKYSF